MLNDYVTTETGAGVGGRTGDSGIALGCHAAVSLLGRSAFSGVLRGLRSQSMVVEAALPFGISARLLQ